MFPGIGTLADSIAGAVFAGLKNEFDTGARARDDVFVVDSFRVFEEAISSFAADQGGTEGFWFNLVHPSSLANADYLSDGIAAQLLAESSVNPWLFVCLTLYVRLPHRPCRSLEPAPLPLK